jgi:formylglycine-generating enzyme required for sulfatase activity
MRILFTTVKPTIAIALAVASAAGCLGSCDGSSGGEPDSGTDTDADTDSDTDTGTEPDLSWDGGPMIPCDGGQHPGQVCVPGGTYLMGCMPYDTECEPNELPMVEVTLSPFWIDIEEARYEEIIPFLNTLHDGFIREESSVLTDEAEQKGIWSRWSDGPPICLNDLNEYVWEQAACESTAICTNRTIEASAGGLGWLGAKLYCEHKGKRLPTEPEWEAAARGQTKLIWPCAWYHLSCWYGKYDCCHTSDECFHPFCENCCIPFPVEETAPCTSPNGVNRMYGNAAEWVLDWRDESGDHSACAEGCTDPAPGSGERPIIKGGSVAQNWPDTRISHRHVFDGQFPDLGTRFAGVRCVSSPVSFDEPDGGPDGDSDSGK